MQQPEDHLAGEHALLAHGLAYGGQVGQLGQLAARNLVALGHDVVLHGRNRDRHRSGQKIAEPSRGVRQLRKPVLVARAAHSSRAVDATPAYPR